MLSLFKYNKINKIACLGSLTTKCYNSTLPDQDTTLAKCTYAFKTITQINMTIKVILTDYSHFPSSFILTS